MEASYLSANDIQWTSFNNDNSSEWINDTTYNVSKHSRRLPLTMPNSTVTAVACTSSARVALSIYSMSTTSVTVLCYALTRGANDTTCKTVASSSYGRIIAIGY